MTATTARAMTATTPATSTGSQTSRNATQQRDSRMTGETSASSRRLTQLTSAELEAVRFVMENKYEAVFHESFDDKNAEAELFDNAPQIDRPDTSWYHPVMDHLDDTPVVPKSTGQVLLSGEQERVLFYKFNYCRYRVQLLKDEVEGRPVDRVGVRRGREMAKWYVRAEELRDQIAQINLALVLAMAKRTRMSEVDFGDMISEGNMALLRAIDKFDVSRGFKFSTYACRAILKGFSRMGIKSSRHKAMFPTDFDPALERSDFMKIKRRTHEEDCADEVKVIVRENHAELSDIEQEVIEHRFGLSKRYDLPDEEPSPLTLEQVGKIIGVTKERVRQIQNKALDKIRQTLEGRYLD